MPFAPLTLLLIAITAPALGAGGSIGDCLRQTRRDELLNENAKVSAAEYKQTNARNLHEVAGNFGDEFAAGLTSGHTVIDAGGGFSIYGIELAGRGVDVVSINTQDFYGELIYPLTQADFALAIKEARSQRDALPTELGNANFATLLRLSRGLGIEAPDCIEPIRRSAYQWRLKTGHTDEAIASALLAWKESLVRKLEQVPFARHFQRRIGLAQDVLPKVPAGSADRVIDFFGAYYYSSDRLNLLDLYYASLKPGGRAYIAVETLKDIVKGKDGDVPFVEFLVATYPEIFRYESVGTWGSPSKVLILRKPEAAPALNLANELTTHTGLETRNSNGYVVPVNEFTPRVH